MLRAELEEAEVLAVDHGDGEHNQDRPDDSSEEPCDVLRHSHSPVF